MLTSSGAFLRLRLRERGYVGRGKAPLVRWVIWYLTLYLDLNTERLTRGRGRNDFTLPGNSRHLTYFCRCEYCVLSLSLFLLLLKVNAGKIIYTHTRTHTERGNRRPTQTLTNRSGEFNLSLPVDLLWSPPPDCLPDAGTFCSSVRSNRRLFY